MSKPREPPSPLSLARMTVEQFDDLTPGQLRAMQERSLFRFVNPATITFVAKRAREQALAKELAKQNTKAAVKRRERVAAVVAGEAPKIRRYPATAAKQRELVAKFKEAKRAEREARAREKFERLRRANIAAAPNF